ncbi:hypothetical protein L7F22_001718 [Adiantum nelumboides]|nr:hypothetical protein [Adiantum nelumboides]
MMCKSLTLISTSVTDSSSSAVNFESHVPESLSAFMLVPVLPRLSSHMNVFSDSASTEGTCTGFTEQFTSSRLWRLLRLKSTAVEKLAVRGQFLRLREVRWRGGSELSHRRMSSDVLQGFAALKGTFSCRRAAIWEISRSEGETGAGATAGVGGKDGGVAFGVDFGGGVAVGGADFGGATGGVEVTLADGLGGGDATFLGGGAATGGTAVGSGGDAASTNGGEAFGAVAATLGGVAALVVVGGGAAASLATGGEAVAVVGAEAGVPAPITMLMGTIIIPNHNVSICILLLILLLLRYPILGLLGTTVDLAASSIAD